MRLDKGGVTTDPLLRSLVTLPTTSIGSSPPVEDDSGRRLGRMASWKELSGRSLRWGWLRSKRDGDSRATQMSECSLGSLSSTCLHRGSKGWQLNLFQALQAMGNRGKIEMTIDGGITMAGKMFCASG